LLINI